MPAGWVAAAAAVVGAVGSMSAASTQAKAANNATANTKAMYQQNESNLAPYMQLGTGAGTQLSTLLGTNGNTGAAGYGSLTKPFTSQDYLNNQDPGYQFQLQQGQQALQNSQAADSGILSGSALKGLIGYNQGMAGTGYQNAYNRYVTNQNNTYSRLSGLSSLGENAAAGAGYASTQFGQSMAGTITGAGNASAAGTVGASNAINSGLGYYQLSNMIKNNTGNPMLSQGFYGNNSSGYTDTQPYNVGPQLPSDGGP